MGRPRGETRPVSGPAKPGFSNWCRSGLTREGGGGRNPPSAFDRMCAAALFGGSVKFRDGRRQAVVPPQERIEMSPVPR
jgi:hypothetical protein